METRPLTDENAEDARSVILARFPMSALDVLEKTMSNPLRSECSEIGDIAYEDGRPVGFRAANRRRMHFGAEPILGRVRGLTCRTIDSPKTVMPALCMAQTNSPRGCSIAYSNTQSPPTEKRAKAMGFLQGPESCSRFLCRPVRPLSFLLYFVLRKVFKWDMSKIRRVKIGTALWCKEFDGIRVRRILEIERSFFTRLMAEYLKSNEGLVSDRDPETMAWLFEKGLKESTIVILTAERNGRPYGSAVLRTDEFSRQWTLIDWFAVRNDDAVLEALLKGACVFLKAQTPALVLKTIGYPDYIQGLLKRYLPRVRQTGVNWFSYNFLSEDLARKCGESVEGRKSWFFGPFDGDFCM